MLFLFFFFFFFFRLLVRRVFPQEGKQTEEWTLNKTGSKMILNQRHLLFVGYRQDCMQYICSGGLLPGTSAAFWNHSNTSRRKQLHCTDNKTMSGGSSSTKGSAGISGNHYSVRRRHQTPTGPPWNLNSTFDCGHKYTRVKKKKKNPFSLRKSRAVTSCYEVGVYVLQRRRALWFGLPCSFAALPTAMFSTAQI